MSAGMASMFFVASSLDATTLVLDHSLCASVPLHQYAVVHFAFNPPVRLAGRWGSELPSWMKFVVGHGCDGCVCVCVLSINTARVARLPHLGFLELIMNQTNQYGLLE